ncbi:hypothetical protein LNQ03_22700 [Klebsiella pneumoniae subsp. pneumoniae]|nr:hypothetical protein [Klebsiella pneumoniae subsp. pneumoniae]
MGLTVCWKAMGCKSLNSLPPWYLPASGRLFSHCKLFCGSLINSTVVKVDQNKVGGELDNTLFGEDAYSEKN